ncbi:hypothetical protein JYU34_018340 [Plutella xylostella]|uniref:Uncharacterized protein n=1 Tax=Plutella xylostella TaxID=51655 RepID=A0ABQ7PXA8_PLUXY|nr:hypothetical protein JYU34_018340 [Plutella xylostella]
MSVQNGGYNSYHAVLEQRVPPRTPGEPSRKKKKITDRTTSIHQTYMVFSHSPHDNGAEGGRTCQLHAKESSLVEIQESDSDWWKPWTDKSSDGEESKVEKKLPHIIAQNETQKSLWSHTVRPESRRSLRADRLCGGPPPRQDKPKQYSYNSMIPSYPCRAEHRSRHAGPDDDLIPLLLPAKLTSPSTSVNFLSLDFERNPLINLFQSAPRGPPWRCSRPPRGRRRHARLHLHAQSREPPWRCTRDMTRSTKRLCSAARRIIVAGHRPRPHQVDLQPQLSLWRRHLHGLEENCTDSLTRKCTFQILFCDSSDPWREARKSADSELHLVPKTKIQVVFSNSTKKDYKLLPR